MNNLLAEGLLILSTITAITIFFLKKPQAVLKLLPIEKSRGQSVASFHKEIRIAILSVYLLCSCCYVIPVYSLKYYCQHKNKNFN